MFRALFRITFYVLGISTNIPIPIPVLFSFGALIFDGFSFRFDRFETCAFISIAISTLIGFANAIYRILLSSTDLSQSCTFSLVVSLFIFTFNSIYLNCSPNFSIILAIVFVYFTSKNINLNFQFRFYCRFQCMQYIPLNCFQCVSNRLPTCCC